jgi:hypothetical protein
VSTNQFVSLPPDVLAGSQKFDVINLLATVARASLPGAFPGNSTERDLETRFSGVSTIGLPDAVSWLAQIGVKMQPLDDQVTAITNGQPEPLHQALQQGNDTQCLQLLAVNDSSKLVEVEDTAEMQLTSRPMAKDPNPCLLLRLGYNTESGYAYYAASLPGDSRRPIKITWDSVVVAGISAAVAILPPPKPVDLERAAASLHIMNQALTTAASAHADILDALGQPAVTMQPAPAQAV